MSFSIISSDPGITRLRVVGALDEATTYILRLELATLLQHRPPHVELAVPYPLPSDDALRGLLLSFFELLRAQGGLLQLRDRRDRPVVITKARDMERLLAPSIDG